MRISRRRWLGAMGALGAAAALPGCGDATAVVAMVTDVEPFRALLSIWANQPRPITVRVVHADGFELFRYEIEIDEWGHGLAMLGGLEPATRYTVTVETADGGGDGPLSFATLPEPTTAAPMRVLFGADVDPDPAYASPIFETIADLDGDVMFSLGDWPYADNYRVLTRSDYEYAHLQARAATRVRPMRTSNAIVAIYDDHEFANDWDGQTRADAPLQHAAALAAWDAWFPRLTTGPRYGSWRLGALLECFVLDTRAFRSANSAPDDASKTMLGAEQRAWLIDAVTRSTAPFRVIATSVPLDFGSGDDHWAAFATERDAILDALAAANTPGVMFIAGDQHWFAAHRHQYGVREFQIGPLARGILTPPPERPGVLTRILEYNVGVIEVSAEPRLRFRAVSATGTTLHDESFTPDDLRITTT